MAEFEITAIIGEGGFGIVYQAFDHSLQRTVAIKEYMPSGLAGRGADLTVVVRSKRQQETFDTGLKSFIHEARLLAQFDHPALIKVYRFWEENKTAYMAMRCYEGVTLKNIIENDPARVTEAWLKSVLKPILEALEVLYKVQILHRDISPDNIIIQKNSEPVLLDFGAARQIIGNMTQALTVILKPGYAPIEQYADDASMKQGPWTDIYSLSAVVYSLIVKKPPPTSVARMIDDPIEELRSGVNIGFSEELLSAINKGLAVKPDDRPQTIEEFRTLLGIGPSTSVTADGYSASIFPIAPTRKALTQDPGRRARIAPPGTDFREIERDAPKLAEPSHRRSGSEAPKVVLAILVSSILVATASAGYLLLSHNTEQPTAEARPAAVSEGPSDRSAPRASSGLVESVAANEETSAWEALFDEAPVSLEAMAGFVRKYPSGKYAGLAREKMAELQANAKAATRPVVTATPHENSAATGTGGVPATSRAMDNPADPTSNRQDVDKSAKPARTVKLMIKPWGNVLLDGTEQGVSPPLKKLTIPEGKHQIRIVNPSFPDYVVELDAATKKLGNIEYDFAPARK